MDPFLFPGELLLGGWEKMGSVMDLVFWFAILFMFGGFISVFLTSDLKSRIKSLAMAYLGSVFAIGFGSAGTVKGTPAFKLAWAGLFVSLIAIMFIGGKLQYEKELKEKKKKMKEEKKEEKKQKGGGEEKNEEC